MSDDQNSKSRPAKKPRVERKRSKRWVFTLNNPAPEEEKSICELVGDGEVVNRVIFGREKGESGTRHLQGRLETVERVGIKRVKELLGKRAHVEVERGTVVQSEDYCKKDGDYVEYGQTRHNEGRGRRTDLETIREDIIAGKSELDIADSYFSQWCIYRKSFAVYRSLRGRRRTWKSYVVVLHGATGTGKTRYVHDRYPDVWVLADPSGKWFDGYNGQEVVLFDDFDSQIDYRFMLLLLDRYPMQVPVKGGFTNWCPKRIYITSNVNPSEWYRSAWADKDTSHLLRRLDKIKECV